MQVTELGLGTWGLSGDGYGEVDPAEQDAVIDRALDLGINLFETADVYAKGKMEAKLGERLPDDGETFIVTKLGTDMSAAPPRKRFDVEYLKQAFDKSQERIKRDVLDIVLLHNPSVAALEKGEATAWLQQQTDAGRLRAWGISAGDMEVARAMLKLEQVPHVVQLAFNVFLSRDLTSLSKDLEERNIAVFARSVLAHGLLAGQWPTDKKFPPEDHRSERWTADQVRRRIHQLRALRVMNTAGKVTSMRGGAVAYVLSHEQVCCAILGPRNVVQLDQLVRETPGEPPYLTEVVRQRLHSELQRVNVDV